MELQSPSPLPPLQIAGKIKMHTRSDLGVFLLLKNKNKNRYICNINR
jgi:hypothetical protein